MYIEPGKSIFVDSITPHIHVGEPLSVLVNGDLDVGSNDIHAANVSSDSDVKTKYLATAGASRIGVSSDFAMLNNKKLKS